MKIFLPISACACLAALLSLAFCSVPALKASTAQTEKTAVLWLGQASFRITPPGGKVIVTDLWLWPYPLTPPHYKNRKALGKGTPAELMRAPGSTSTRVPPLRPFEKAEA